METFGLRAEVIEYTGTNAQEFTDAYPFNYKYENGVLSNAFTGQEVEIGDRSVMLFNMPDPQIVKSDVFERFFVAELPSA